MAKKAALPKLTRTTSPQRRKESELANQPTARGRRRPADARIGGLGAEAGRLPVQGPVGQPAVEGRWRVRQVGTAEPRHRFVGTAADESSGAAPAPGRAREGRRRTRR